MPESPETESADLRRLAGDKPIEIRVWLDTNTKPNRIARAERFEEGGPELIGYLEMGTDHLWELTDPSGDSAQVTTATALRFVRDEADAILDAQAASWVATMSDVAVGRLNRRAAGLDRLAAKAGNDAETARRHAINAVEDILNFHSD